MHLFSGPTVPSTGVLCSRSNPLSTRPPHFPSILSSAAPARAHSRSTVPPILRFHAAPILTPGDTLLSLCGCFRPGSRIHDTASPIPHQPAPSLPSPLSRCTVLPSLQVALLHPRQNQFSPPALLVSSARASQWPPTFKLAKSLAEAPGKGGQRQPALPGASCASRLPAWAPRGAQPSPHRPTAAQTYLRVARRGLR